jgi:hypothetical protein
MYVVMLRLWEVIMVCDDVTILDCVFKVAASFSYFMLPKSWFEFRYQNPYD